MGMKHKVEKSSGEILYATEWNDEHDNDMRGEPIKNVGAPIDLTDAARKQEIDTHEAKNTGVHGAGVNYLMYHKSAGIVCPTSLSNLIPTTELNLVYGGREATILVAASNSTNKDKANYVCDGVDDQEEINAAINDLPPNGGKVVLLEGDYNISAPVKILKNNVILEGCGWATKLFLVNNANCNVIEVGDGTTALSGIVIRDLQIDGNKSNQTTGQCIYFKGASGYEITSSAIIHCKVVNSRLYGIRLDYINYCFILMNVISGSRDSGLYLYNSLYNMIFGNHSENSPDSGIWLQNSNHNVVNANVCPSNLDNGITLYSSSYNSVVGNVLFSNAGNGVALYYANHNSITSNSCHSNDVGVYMEYANNNIISSNNMSLEGGFAAIHIYESDNNIILGNYCSNHEYGIYVDVGSDANYIGKNYIINVWTGSTQDDGVGTIWGVLDTANNIDNVV